MTIPPNKTPIDDLAPTPLEELLAEENLAEDQEDEEGKGGDGKKSGGGGKQPNVRIPGKNEEDLSEYDSESLIERLKMLVWAPFSSMVPGASSFESEHDLKRTLFLGQLGLMTNQIDPHDIADPKLIDRLEQRNQERQQQYSAEIAAASAGSAAALGGLITSLQEVPKEQQKKQEAKLQAQQPKEASLDAKVEAEDKKPEAEKKAQFQQKVEPKIETPPEAEENSFAAEIDRNEGNELPKKDGFGLDELVDILEVGQNRNETIYDVSEPVKGLSSMTEIAALFNVSAQQTEYSASEQKVDFKFADPAPKLSSSPMGGV